jgi:hypothetical protein
MGQEEDLYDPGCDGKVAAARLGLFSQTAEASAHQTREVRRTRRITGALFLPALRWTVYQPGPMTMPALAATAAERAPVCHASEQAWHARFQSPAVAGLQARCAHALHESVGARAAVVPLRATLAAVYLLDSTFVALPAALAPPWAGGGREASGAAVTVFVLLHGRTGSDEPCARCEGRTAAQAMGLPGRAARPARCGSLLSGCGAWRFASPSRGQAVSVCPAGNRTSRCAGRTVSGRGAR